MPSHTLILTLLMLSLHSLKKYRRTGIQFSCSEAKFLKFDVLSGSSWACATERESWRGTQDRPTHKRSFKSQWVYVTVSAVQTFWCPKVWPGCRGNPRPAGAHVTAPTSQRWPSQCGRSETAAPATRLERRGEERRRLEPWRGRVRPSAHGGAEKKNAAAKTARKTGRGFRAQWYLWCEGPTVWCVCRCCLRPAVDTEVSRKYS